MTSEFTNDTFKFAQTYRDSHSGIDYAKNRNYSSSIGRFLTLDRVSGVPALPLKYLAAGNTLHRYGRVGIASTNFAFAFLAHHAQVLSVSILTRGELGASPRQPGVILTRPSVDS